MDSAFTGLDNLILSVIFEHRKFSDAAARIREEYALEIYCLDGLGRVIFGRSTDKFSNWFATVNQSFFSRLHNGCVQVGAGEIDEYCYTFAVDADSEGLRRIAALVHHGAHRPEFLEYCAKRTLDLIIWYDGNSKRSGTNSAPNIDFLARELLMNDDSSIDQLLGRTYFQVTSFKSDYAVAAIRQGSGKHRLVDVQSALHSTFRDCFSLIEGDCLLIFIYNLPSSAERLELLCGNFEGFCLKYGVVASLSSRFSNLSQRLHYVEQAIDALKLGPFYKEGPIYSADRLYAPLILFSAFNQIGSEMALLSGIGMLSDFDEANDSEYLRSMECYFDCANNATTAAKELYIDRSTLKYRLEKAASILAGNDLEDPETVIRLRTGIEMYKFYCREHS